MMSPKDQVVVVAHEAPREGLEAVKTFDVRGDFDEFGCVFAV